MSVTAVAFFTQVIPGCKFEVTYDEGSLVQSLLVYLKAIPNAVVFNRSLCPYEGRKFVLIITKIYTLDP